VAVRHIPASQIPNDRSAIEAEGFTVAAVTIDGSGDLGQWHHHGDHHVVAYVLSGTIRVEYGPGGRQTIDATAGDLVHLEPATIHREAYGPGEVASVGMYFGTGPGRVDVEGPEGEG
jgi:uncharacterized RmlC-like cupin family protein